MRTRTKIMKMIMTIMMIIIPVANINTVMMSDVEIMEAGNVLKIAIVDYHDVADNLRAVVLVV